ncbi:DNA gyrase inhibitor YacG [Bartonella gliris]|uniref:DNA gyrase inhibitor YacG n=1 Tax=Bartonella gliris TaxID=3004109 RepID=UPI00295E4ED9|nr:DNA gyrase inhibitor YacG [Bartonella gliris]
MEQGKKQQVKGKKNQKKVLSEKTLKSREQRVQTQRIPKEPNLTQTETSPLRPPHPCPICGQMAQQNSYPFCSTRCRAIDLNRWLSGAYILPPPPHKADEEE